MNEEKKSSILVLQHLLKCGLLDPHIIDEVLPTFSADSASTVAISIISNFSQDGASPFLDSPTTIDWVMQVVAYCLSLQTLFRESISQSMSVFRFWLKHKSFFPENQTWNKYARLIFRFLSQIFEYKNDYGDYSDRLDLIQIVMNDFDDYQENLADIFEDQTWNILLRILIGEADYLLQDENTKIFTATDRKQLLATCFTILFNSMVNSKQTDTDIWSIFFKFTKTWSVNDTFMATWSNHIIILWRRVLSSLYNQDLSLKDSNNSLKLLGFQLHQFIKCIDYDTARKSKIIHELVERLYKECKHFTEQTKSLYFNVFPADLFFGLFGEWCFNISSTENINGHSYLIKTLMSIVGHWTISKPWQQVIFTNIKSILENARSQLVISVIMNGHFFLNRFMSMEVCEMFLKVIDAFEMKSSINIDFWFSFSTLLSTINEITSINPTILQKFITSQSHYRARLDIMEINLKQDSKAFMQHAVLFINKAISLVNQEHMLYPPEESFTLIDFLTNICLMIASAPAFMSINGIEDLLVSLHHCVTIYSNNDDYLHSYLILIASICKWHPACFKKDYAVQLISFLVNQYQDKRINIQELHNMARLITGRSLNLAFQKPKNDNITKVFMLDSESIISIVDDENPESFQIQIRDARGYFSWNLKDELPIDLLYPPEMEKLEIKNSLSTKGNNYISFTESIHKERGNELKGKIDSSKCYDNFYDETHDKNLMINMMSNDHKLRHKWIDFIVQMGLSKQVRILEDDPGNVIKRFDDIRATSLIEIPVFHFLETGQTAESTPHFKRFVSNLGSVNDQNDILTHLGLLDIKFVPNKVDGSFIGIMFSESPLKLNIIHKTIPKMELLIVAKPIDQTFYSVRCVSKNPLFWSNAYVERPVNNQNLARLVSCAIFNYVSITRRDILFEQDNARAEYLKSIKTNPISPLALVRSI